MEKHTTSTSRIIICLATILLLGAPTAHGERLKAKIEFEPRTVVPLVTLRLSLKCALVPADTKDEDVVFYVKSVVGVNIKQKNTDGEFETVASVSYSAPDDPKLHGKWDDKDTAADAHLDDYSRLLEVNVSEPAVEHTGDMLCEIDVNTFVNDEEAVKTLSNRDTIGYQEPELPILSTILSELRRLKLENEDQQQNISAQQQEMVSQMSELRRLKLENKDQQQEISTQQQSISAQQQGMVSQMSELRRLKLQNEDQQQNVLAQQQEMVSQMEELREAKNKIETAENKIKTAEEKIKTAEEKIKDLETTVSTQVVFSAVMDGKTTEQVSPNTDIIFNKTLVNIGEGYDTSTGVFTCPVAGSYYIRYDMQVSPRIGWTTSAVQLVRNGVKVTFSHMYDADTASKAYGDIGAGVVLQLEQGDKLKVRTWGARSNFYWRYSGAYACMFTGYLLK